MAGQATIHFTRLMFKDKWATLVYVAFQARLLTAV
jgi:hypothetical protein